MKVFATTFLLYLVTLLLFRWLIEVSFVYHRPFELNKSYFSVNIIDSIELILVVLALSFSVIVYVYSRYAKNYGSSPVIKRLLISTTFINFLTLVIVSIFWGVFYAFYDDFHREHKEMSTLSEDLFSYPVALLISAFLQLEFGEFRLLAAVMFLVSFGILEFLRFRGLYKKE